MYTAIAKSERHGNNHRRHVASHDGWFVFEVTFDFHDTLYTFIPKGMKRPSISESDTS